MAEPHDLDLYKSERHCRKDRLFFPNKVRGVATESKQTYSRTCDIPGWNSEQLLRGAGNGVHLIGDAGGDRPHPGREQ